MKFTSAIMTAASGKVRGLVASHNKGGAYFRGKTIPTNPSSARQVAQRSRLSDLMGRWRQILTGVQRAAWDVYAKNVTTVDALGNSISLSGPNWYVGANSLRMQASLTVIDAGPTIFAQASLTPLNGTIYANAGTALIGYNGADDWNGTNTGGGCLLFFSRPQNSTVNYFTGPYAYAQTLATGSTAANTVVTLPFTAGPVGSKIFMKAVATAGDGRFSGPFRAGFNA